MRRSLLLIALFTGMLYTGCQSDLPPAAVDEVEHVHAAAANDIAGLLCRGCSPGYWKNHLDAWGPTGLSPDQTVESLFSGAAIYPDIASATLLEALKFGGGSGNEGAARNLMRAAVAAALNALHPEVAEAYGYDTGLSFERLERGVNGRLERSHNRQPLIELAEVLDAHNNSGSPLCDD